MSFFNAWWDRWRRLISISSRKCRRQELARFAYALACEPRQLLSGTTQSGIKWSLSNGLLTINGTAKDDSLRVQATNGYVELIDNGSTHATGLSLSQVSTIRINGLVGNDTLILVESLGMVRGILYGGDGNDVLVGAGGNDTLIGGGGADSFSGNGGDDTITVDELDTSIVGGLGFDRAGAQSAASAVNIVLNGIERFDGSAFGDTISAVGTTGPVTIMGHGGNDMITGGNGNDQLFGGVGNDTINGGAGNDTIYGEVGADSINGGNDNDSIVIDDTDTSVIGGSGRDIVTTSATSGALNLVLTDANGIEEVRGTALGDTINASAMTTGITLRGNAGADILTGGGGNDTILGGTGADTLKGLEGNDYLNGESGSDILYGGAGNDNLLGQTSGDDFEPDVAFDSSGTNAFVLTGPDKRPMNAPSVAIDSLIAVARDAAIGSFIANVIVTDADVLLGDRVTTALVGDAGGRVELAGGKLRTKRALTPVDVGTHTITVTATDEQGLETRREIQFNVTSTVEEIRTLETEMERERSRLGVELAVTQDSLSTLGSPLDHPSWITAGAPSGSLGMITSPGDGNKYSVSLDPTGRYLLVTSQSHTVFIVDVVTGETLTDRSFSGHANLVTDAEFSNDGSFVATASYDNNARVFGSNGNLLATIPLQNIGVGIHFSPSSELLVASVANRPGLLIDTKSFLVMGELPATWTAMDPRFTPNESSIVYTDNYYVTSMDLKTKQIHTVYAGIGDIYAGDLSPDGQYYAVGSLTGMVAVIDLNTQQVVSKFQGDGSAVLSLSFSPNNELVVGYDSGKVAVYDASQPIGGMPLLNDFQLGAPVRSVFISPTGRTFGVLISRDAPADSQITVFPLPKAGNIGQGSTKVHRTPQEISADIVTLNEALTLLSQGQSDATGAEIQAVADLLLSIQSQADFTSTVIAPVSSEDTIANTEYLHQKGSELKTHLEAVAAIQSRVTALAAATSSKVTKAGIVQLRSKLQIVSNRLAKEKGELEQQALRLAITIERLNAALTSPPGTVITRTDNVDLSTAVAVIGRDGVLELSHEVLAAGGSLSISSVQGRTSTLTLDQITAGEDPSVVGTGRFFGLDFANVKSLVTAVTLTPASTRITDQIRITYVRNGEKIGEQISPSGSPITFEDVAGITGVLIENAVQLMSDDARAFDNYRRPYKIVSRGDPGPRFQYFNTVRPDLKQREAEIVEDANRGDVFLPLSLSRVYLKSNIAAPQSAVAPLSGATSGTYSILAAPRIDSLNLPNSYSFAVSFPHDANLYNRVSLVKFSAAPVLQYVGYMDLAGNFVRLPQGSYTVLDNGDWVIHPLGQSIQLAAVVTGGYPGRINMDVGQNFDFNVATQSGPRLQDTLPLAGQHITSEDLTLYDVNHGGTLGWNSGNSLQYQTESPVALGTIKAKIRLTNPGFDPVAFRVLVYSGNQNVPGWDTVQSTYTYTLGPSESRTLTTPVVMNPDANGRGAVRFIVEDMAGHFLGEFGRGVRAPRSMDGREVTPEGTLVWKSIPLTTEETEQRVRIAQRGLVSAQASGNPGRIATAQKGVTAAAADHNAAVDRAKAANGTAVVKSTDEIISDTNAPLSTELPGSDTEEQKVSLERLSSVLVASVGELLEVNATETSSSKALSRSEVTAQARLFISHLKSARTDKGTSLVTYALMEGILSAEAYLYGHSLFGKMRYVIDALGRGSGRGPFQLHEAAIADADKNFSQEISHFASSYGEPPSTWEAKADDPMYSVVYAICIAIAKINYAVELYVTSGNASIMTDDDIVSFGLVLYNGSKPRISSLRVKIASHLGFPSPETEGKTFVTWEIIEDNSTLADDDQKESIDYVRIAKGDSPMFS